MVKIKLPEAKPAYEWVNGRALQKVSPKQRHGIAQLRFASALDAWAQARGAGSVATEWRFHVKPPGEVRRPLVPDVAFVSFQTIPHSALQATEEPAIAPNAVVEVKSPGDRQADIDEKVRVYLSAGTSVVFLVDPQTRSVIVCDARSTHTLSDRQAITHTSLPGFRLDCSRLFEMIRPKRKKGVTKQRRRSFDRLLSFS